MIRTIPNTPKITRIRYCPEFSAICSIGGASFYGVVEIEYEPAEYLLEFESFEKWLKSLSLDELTVEDLSRVIFDKLSENLGDVPLIVSLNAQTTVHAPVTAMIRRE